MRAAKAALCALPATIAILASSGYAVTLADLAVPGASFDMAPFAYFSDFQLAVHGSASIDPAAVTVTPVSTNPPGNFGLLFAGPISGSAGGVVDISYQTTHAYTVDCLTLNLTGSTAPDGRIDALSHVSYSIYPDIGVVNVALLPGQTSIRDGAPFDLVYNTVLTIDTRLTFVGPGGSLDSVATTFIPPNDVPGGSPDPLPEPASATLLGLALAGLALRRRST